MKKKAILLIAFVLLAISCTGRKENGVLLAQSGGSRNNATPEADFEITQNEHGTISITGYTGRAKDVVIPETIEGIRVTHIGNYVFHEKGLTSVTIPNSVTYIGQHAFSRNQLTSITIPNSVTHISGGAFRYNQLTNVIIPDSVTFISSWAFSDNQLTSVTISGSVYQLMGFGNNRLTSINIPSCVTIFNEAFENNQLTSVNIPSGVTRIHERAFRNNQLTSVTIPDSVTRIDRDAFAGNPTINSITIGANKDYANHFPHNFESFYQSQNRRAGTYTWSGRLWSVQ